VADSWLILDIGKKQYAINAGYIKSVSTLNSGDFLSQSNKPFVRGIYKMLSSEIPVINGRKLVCEPTLAEENTRFTKELTDIKFDIMHWLDALDLAIFMGDNESLSYSKESIDKIVYRVSNLKVEDNQYITSNINKLSKTLAQNMSRANSVIEKQMKKYSKSSIEEIKTDEIYQELAEIRKNVEKYTYNIIDSIIEVFCQDKRETCVVIGLNDTQRRIFGIAVDRITYINSETCSVSKHEKTFLSAGVLTVESKEYNILNLSKLIRII
jgi:hypothetical protein